MYRRRLFPPLFPMKVEKTLAISATGALTVTITPKPAKGYVSTQYYIEVNWTPVVEDGVVDISFGDGTTASKTAMPIVTFPKKYSAAGTYTITASARDTATGATGSGSASVLVADDLIVTFAADKTSGAVPLAVTFTCGATKGYLPYTWTLDPGDGSSPYSGSRTSMGTWTQPHTYKTGGTFMAKLTVTDSLGGSSLALVSIGAGKLVLFPKLREMFPRLFGGIDKIRQKIPYSSVA